MNPYVLLALAVAIAAAGAGGFKLGVDHEYTSQAREDKHITEAIDAATNASAQAIAALKPTYTTIQSKVQHDVETHTVYRDCKLSSDGLLLANQALNAGVIAPGGSKLPEADAAK